MSGADRGATSVDATGPSAAPAPHATGRAPGFVATKPLQILTALNLARQWGRPDAELCVVPNFADARRSIERLRLEADAFARVHTAPTRATAIATLALRGGTDLLADSDVGFRTTSMMRLIAAARRDVRFALYEEGTSLLEPQDDQRPHRWFARLGVTMALGAGRLTREVWSYSPEIVRRRLAQQQVGKIEQSLASFVRDHREMWMRVFWPDAAEHADAWRGHRCLLYLSSWKADPKAFEILARASAFTICKLHPHIRQDVAVRGAVDQVLPPGVPAELVVLELARRFDDVQVLHEASAVAGYLNLPNVRFVDLKDVRPERIDTQDADPPRPG